MGEKRERGRENEGRGRRRRSGGEEKGVGEPLVDVTAIIEVSYALFEFLSFL